MATPTLDQFLLEVAQTLQARDGVKLQNILILEPPLPPIYQTLVGELQQTFASNKRNELQKRCERTLHQDEDGSGGSWPQFILFLIGHFAFIRDVNPAQLLETHGKLKALLRYVSENVKLLS
jgi:nuclear mRNA export protein PCID2/THP1